MRAEWKGAVLAESDCTIELGGYHHFPREALRAAWTYEAPRPSHQAIDHWVGFWKDVRLAP